MLLLKLLCNYIYGDIWKIFPKYLRYYLNTKVRKYLKDKLRSWFLIFSLLKSHKIHNTSIFTKRWILLWLFPSPPRAALCYKNNRLSYAGGTKAIMAGPLSRALAKASRCGEEGHWRGNEKMSYLYCIQNDTLHSQLTTVLRWR